MTKVTNIPSRLHSVEKGNVVAGANEILDDTKGKKQNVINQETDAELLRLEQAKQDNLTFDSTPTENSTNPVTSGGVYAADALLQQAIEAILLLIPSAATALNQLADKAFVNSSISTATATFRGTYNSVTDLHLTVDATHAQIEAALATAIATADNNDYCFVQIPVSSSSTDIAKTERYKYNGTAWVFEYELNTSGFTAAQWAAINSGITDALVTKLGDLPTATELSTDLQGLSTAIGSEETRAKGVEQGLSTDIQDILGLIPSEATSSNQLADKTYVTNLINAITALIPVEATDQNQLADKAYVLAHILAATPAFKGQFTTLTDLEAVSSPKVGDIGIVRTTDSDGFAVFTFYQYLNNQWNVYYTLVHHLQNKPATTGTTGDYPYNGMGRVVLPMNIKEIGGVTANYMEQSMMPTATGGNTIYVITHDYILASDMTIPANCVLEFDGGSIDGNYTLTFNDTSVISSKACFGANLTLAGKVLQEASPEWFIGTDADKIEKAINTFSVVKLAARDYNITRQIIIKHSFALKGSSIPDFFGNYSQSRLIGTDIINSILLIESNVVATYMSSTIQNVSFTCSVAQGCDGIRWSTTDGPSRPMSIMNCNFKGLDKAIYVYSTYGSTNISNLLLLSCNVTGNNWGLYTEGARALMMLKVLCCNGEQNINGFLYSNDVSGGSLRDVSIERTLLEGQPTPITAFISGTFEIKGCYFERTGTQMATISITGKTAALFRFEDNIIVSNNLTLELYGLKFTALNNFDPTARITVNASSVTFTEYNQRFKYNTLLNCTFFCELPEHNPDIAENFDAFINTIAEGKPLARTHVGDNWDAVSSFYTSVPIGDYRYVVKIFSGSVNGGSLTVNQLNISANWYADNGKPTYFVTDGSTASELSSFNTRVKGADVDSKAIRSKGALYNKTTLNGAVYKPKLSPSLTDKTNVTNAEVGDTMVNGTKPVFWQGTKWIYADGTDA